MSRPITVLLSILATMLVLVGPASAQQATTAGDAVATAEARFLELINASRAEGHAQPLVVNEELGGIARDWSARMAVDGRLSHNPSYTRQYSGEWRRMAENVGYIRWSGADVEAMVTTLHQRFLDSDGHRRNLMGASYNQVGVGVVVDGDTMWVTVNFLEGPVPASTEQELAADEQPSGAQQPSGRMPYRGRR